MAEDKLVVTLEVRTLQFVAPSEALELTLLLADGDLEKYNRAALRWHVRFVEETKTLDIRKSQPVLALLTAIPANMLAAAALAELLSRRRSCERIAEALGAGRVPLD
jgi:phage baseplate assembly protein gpV